VSGARQHDFYEAIDVLRDMAKHRNQQHKHLFDEIQSLHVQIEKHRKVIVCLEYRHALENLSLGGQGYLMKHKIKRESEFKKATIRWQATWDLAVEMELFRMCTEKHLKVTQTAAPPPSQGIPTSSTTVAQSPSGVVQASSASTGAPLASANAQNAVTPPSLQSLLQKDFNIWSSRNQTKCSDIVTATLARQAAEAAQAAQAALAAQAVRQSSPNNFITLASDDGV
jgi:DNA polymerase III gamma/tau subunit